MTIRRGDNDRLLEVDLLEMTTPKPKFDGPSSGWRSGCTASLGERAFSPARRLNRSSTAIGSRFQSWRGCGRGARSRPFGGHCRVRVKQASRHKKRKKCARELRNDESGDIYRPDPREGIRERTRDGDSWIGEGRRGGEPIGCAESEPRRASTKDTAGLKCAWLIGARSAISVANTATVAAVFASSAIAEFPPARRSAMTPEPTTVAARSSEPIPSAARRRASFMRCRRQAVSGQWRPGAPGA